MRDQTDNKKFDFGLVTGCIRLLERKGKTKVIEKLIKTLLIAFLIVNYGKGWTLDSLKLVTNKW